MRRHRQVAGWHYVIHFTDEGPPSIRQSRGRLINCNKRSALLDSGLLPYRWITVMKRLLIGSLLAAASLNAFATAPGGPGCGWGNMLFEGQSGLPSHLVASITNGTSGNATFGMTSGTNGCDTSGKLAYHGKSMLVLSSIMNELSEDMARGEGEALTTYAVVMGVA